MTERQEKILKVSLELFANEGIKNTTTSMIAKKAEVSEGLIFRHFINKEGLVKEIFKSVIDLLKKETLIPILEGDPKKVLENILNFPFKLLKKKEMFLFWKFMIRIQLDMDIGDSGKICNVDEDVGKEHLFCSEDRPMNNLVKTLEGIFKEQGYENYKEETMSFGYLMKGLFFDKAVGNKLSDQEIEDLRKFILKKYNIL